LKEVKDKIDKIMVDNVGGWCYNTAMKRIPQITHGVILNGKEITHPLGIKKVDVAECPQCDCADNQPDPDADYDLECGACGWKFDRKPATHDPMDGEGDPYYASF
tara:strand:+ start:294 stop:608 length:315 start_codon:yes stop_codon:yes gene_type:complete